MTLWHDPFFEKARPQLPSQQKDGRVEIANENFEKLDCLSFCPVAQSELHLISHHLPICAMEGLHGPEVVLDLRPENILRAPLNRDGKWSLRYKPLALRLLPIAASNDGELYSVYKKNFSEAEEKKIINATANGSILSNYASGRKRLTDSIRILIDENYLEKPNDGHFYKINYKLTFDQTASIPDPFSFQLLVIMIFSQKNLRESDLEYNLFLKEIQFEPAITELDFTDFLSKASNINF
ncbi:hypothetical protein [Donghicola mangrovi]|uniref:SapC family protein n=1 Tax=Donghicola mangrovi TaxID=2729614 RepID=A0A850Q6U8_9RHOB|nr:hypothetical protein [Donghicola mangrovi]NVO21731.1 SapC family protein [Donghicola mangrovi]